jgi:uncharacterized protein (TIGR02186 family)
MAYRPQGGWMRIGLSTAAAVLSLAFGLGVAEAQRAKRPPERPAPPRATEPRPAPATPDAAPTPAAPAEQEPRESVQADVSSRSVAVTSSFTGIEIVVFGAVDNSRQASAESGLYDVVIVLEGTPTRLVARRKSRVAGIWINQQSITYESVPSYYAIVSTRPIEDVADPLTLRENDIGFEHVRMTPIKGWETGVTTADLQDFKGSVIRLKQKEGLYLEEEYGVVFIGRSLFRASLYLPGNVPVGPLDARVYLFRGGKLLSTYIARVRLEREGLERLLHSFAFGQPLLYGFVTVFLSVIAGLFASTVFRRGAH